MEKGIFDPGDWQGFLKNPTVQRNLPTSWEEYFSKEELLDFLKVAHRKFYYRPMIILNALFSASNMNAFLRVIKGGISLFKLEFLNTNNKDF